MIPRQTERIKTKIKNIKAALAADKKQWGGYYYHDGRGYRYLPSQFYIQIEDYTGGLRYLNWFNKNFDNDACYPVFLLEWSIILFKKVGPKGSKIVEEIYAMKENYFLE